MTVNTTNITSGPYVGNGTNDTYSYTFRVEDKTQLSVYETTDAGIQSLLVVDTDYTVNNIGEDGGGTVVRTAGNLPTDYQWYIRSNRVENQLTDFSSQGAFFPDVHEAQMDHITFLIQQLSDKLTRSFKLADSIDIDGDFALAAAQAARVSKFLAFDTNGDIIIASGTGADAGLRADLASVLITQGANLVGIHDAAGKFTATTVEAALAENATSIEALENVASTLDTPIATTSGTTADFTSIPSWVKKITVMLDGVSTDGTGDLIIQIGDSGGLENTGYTTGLYSSVGAPVEYTNGFGVADTSNIAALISGSITLTLMNSSTNTWASQGVLYDSFGSGVMSMSGGTKSLSAVLDRLTLTSVGADTFDAGSVNIMYE